MSTEVPSPEDASPGSLVILAEAHRDTTALQLSILTGPREQILPSPAGILCHPHRATGTETGRKLRPNTIPPALTCSSSLPLSLMHARAHTGLTLQHTLLLQELSLRDTDGPDES